MTAGSTFPVWGGVSTVAVTDPARLDSAVAAVRETIEEFDQACSRFRSDSELSRVNDAGGQEVRVGSLLLEAVAVALRAAELTDGAVDPTVGAAVIALGYDRDFSELDAARAAQLPPPRILARAVPGWRTVRVDPERGAIRLPPDARLDLGATAKALAADRAADRAAAAAGCGVLVGLSGDLALAGSPPPEGWTVRVTDDHRAAPDAPGQTVTVHDGGVATSSTVPCRWQTTGGAVHHLLDPATGVPVVETWRTVTVAAASCCQANIASTAAVVRGHEGRAWLAETSLPARLVGADGTVVHLGGWTLLGEELPVRELQGVAG